MVLSPVREVKIVSPIRTFLRNGPDKNDSTERQRKCWNAKKVLTFLLSVLTSDWLKQQKLTKKNTLSKWSVNAFYCVNSHHVGLCILCVKMRTLLCGKAPLPHNKRNCYPPLVYNYAKSKSDCQTMQDVQPPAFAPR